MQRSHSWPWYCFQILLVAAITAAAYWLGYTRGSRAPNPPTAEAANDFNKPAAAQSPSRSRKSANPAPPQDTSLQEPQAAPNSGRPTANRELTELIDGLARSRSPADALAFINSDELEAHEKGPALRTLVAKWISNNDAISPKEIAQWQNRINSISGNRFGLEVELGLALAQAPLDPSIGEAWMDAYSSHPGRSKLFAGMLGDQFQNDPLQVLGKSSSWTEWEQSQFERQLFQDWARKTPRAAMAWYEQNSEMIGAQIGNDIFDTISQLDPKLASELLPSIQTADQRTRAIETIATNLARRGTEDAIEWADSLKDPSERQSAIEAIYHATPQGIGAMMTRKDGFPLIADIIPGGPLESSGLQRGDLIIQAQEAGGNPTNLYGLPMHDFIGALRGEPGSEVEIRVLRQNPRTSQLEERQVRVTRDILIIPKRETRTEPEQVKP